MDSSDLKRLTIFAEVVENGSFASAARALSLPRSSVSEHVRVLEASLGVRLLQRTTRKLSLTPEGHAVYAKALSIQDIITEINQLTNAQQASGVITVSATQDIAEVWLLPKLKEFNQTYPDICVNIMADDYVSDLIEQSIDVAVRVTPHGRDSSLIGRTLGQESLRLFASPHYIQQQEKPDALECLANWQWVLLQQISTDGKIRLLQGERELVLKPTRHRITNAPTVQKRLMEQGHGIGLHLPSLLSAQVEAGLLCQVMEDVKSTSYDIRLVYPSRKLPKRTRVFVEYLVATGWN